MRASIANKNKLRKRFEFHGYYTHSVRYYYTNTAGEFRFLSRLHSHKSRRTQHYLSPPSPCLAGTVLRVIYYYSGEKLLLLSHSVLCAENADGIIIVRYDRDSSYSTYEYYPII